MRVTLVGTAAERLPRPNCRCRVCLTLTGAPAQAVVDASPVVGGPGATDSRAGDGAPLHLSADGGPRVVSRGGVHLLWAPVDAPLSDDLVDRIAALGSALGAVVIGPSPEHPPVTAAWDVARLRACGAVTPSTVLVLAGARHDHGVDGARRRLAARAWGMTSVSDGTALDLAPRHATPAAFAPAATSPAASSPAAPSTAATAPAAATAHAPAPLRTLVLGPSASGKSAVAEELLAAEPAVLYLATGALPEAPGAGDAEWSRKVAAHRARRPPWWTTLESHDVATALAQADRPVVLDAVGTWLAGVLDRAGAWEDDAGRRADDGAAGRGDGGADWRRRLASEVEALVQAWRQTPVPIVAVSEEVGWGVVPTTRAGRLFRDELGRLNARLAAESERTLLVVAGSPMRLDDAYSPEVGQPTWTR